MIEYKVKLAGCECAVVEWNPGGETLVFALHGWLDNLATFEKLVEFMPEIRLVAFDFPGHGHSEHLVDESAYHFVDGIYLIDDIARHFGQHRINLLGHSMGAAASTLFAASQPERVRKLVMIESLGPLTAEPEEGIRLLSKAVVQRQQQRSKRKPVYQSFEQALTARAVASEINKELIKPIVERGLSKLETGYTWRADSRLRVTSPMRMSEETLNRVIGEISAAVLVIEAGQGFLTNSDKLQARKPLFTHLTTMEISGGHHVHLQKPQLCGERIQSFFQKID